MKYAVMILFSVLFIFFYPLALDADIYTWTDENGVKHYSNTAPEQDAEVMKENQSSGSPETTHERQYSNDNKNVEKTYRKSSPNKVDKAPLLTTVNDPSVASALNNFNDKMKKIGSKCGSKTNAKKCMCDNMPEIIKANQAKIDAFLGLMRRRPELKNQMVKIDGVFGNWYLDPEDPTIKERNNVNFWKKRYNCK